MNAAGKGIARAAQLAATIFARTDQPERQRRRVQALGTQAADDLGDRRRVRDRRVRIGPARRLGRIDAGVAVDVIETLGAIVDGASVS